MGESTCLMPSFNYASGISSEANQGNPMHALGESISFGRFVSESLSWEKWSTFSHKRYVEEAERYAQPGSVAQKKAFFEAHYKKIAARKAAEALLEQESASKNPDTESQGQTCNINTYSSENVEIASTVDGQNNFAELEKLEVGKVVEAESVAEQKDVMENSNGNHQSENVVISEMAEMEKPLLEGCKSSQDASSPISKKIPASTSSKSWVHGKAPKIPASPAKQRVSVHHRKENNVTPITNKFSVESIDRKRSTSKLLLPKIPVSPAKNTVSILHRKENHATPITKKTSAESIDENRATSKLLPKIPASPAKSTSFVNPRNENNVSRKTWKSPIVSMDKKKSISKSLGTLIYSTPAKEPDKSTVPAAKKAESSRVAPSPSKASKDCKTPLRTPLMAFTKGASRNPSAAPSSEDRRTRTPPDPPASGSKTGPKWHILSAVCSKSLSACRNKLQSPTLSVPFNLRTEERAARRKQKLEEKFNAKAVPKVQLQTRIKEKAETELRKLRRSLCFKARPLPEFYKEKETSKDPINDPKTPMTHPEAPKLGRKAISNTTQCTVSLSPISDTHSTKNSGFKNVMQKKKGVPNLLTSLPERINHENTSPNVQQ